MSSQSSMLTFKDVSVVASCLSDSEQNINRLMRGLVGQLVVPVLVLDAECNVLIWNTACEQLTGIAASEVVGTNQYWRAFSDQPSVCILDVMARYCLGEACEGKGNELSMFSGLFSSSSLVQRGQGVSIELACAMAVGAKETYLVIDASPLYDESGRLVAVMQTLQDITEYRRAQIVLQQSAKRDGLTGLVNRRAFDEHLQIEWQRALRDGSSLSLILLDIDSFRHYNTSYGHLSGDDCLKSVAEVLENSLGRGSDLVARYGGDEFAIILPGTEYEGAEIVANRIRSALCALGIPHEEAQALGMVSISSGIAALAPVNDTFSDDLTALANRALYVSKQQGVNGIVSWRDIEMAESMACA
jgi:diguanylate cyclase (GGDEF)-like protein